ncbi:MAG: SCP2 sterol-binding domain-containing protein [Syntrophaceae bacterium]|nr:SCP2 sterol-binding domain-containing protein [Syntrophaceae bacterium]
MNKNKKPSIIKKLTGILMPKRKFVVYSSASKADTGFLERSNKTKRISKKRKRGKPLFLTKEWFDAFIKHLKNDEVYQKEATNFAGKIIFTCLSEPSLHELYRKDMHFYFDSYYGDIRQWQMLETGDNTKADYYITGRYEDWKNIALGNLKLKKAVLVTRKLKIKGNKLQLLKHMKAAERTVKLISEMKNEFYFPDEWTS